MHIIMGAYCPPPTHSHTSRTAPSPSHHPKDKGKSTNIAKDKNIDKDKGKDTDKDDVAGEEPQPMAQDVTCSCFCVSCERRGAKAYRHQGYHLCHAHSGTWVSNDGVQAE